MRRAFIHLAQGLSVLLGGCELEERSLTKPETLLVAEVYVNVGQGPDEVVAFLQQTLGGSLDGSVRESVIQLKGPRGILLNLARADRGLCIEEAILDDVEGACFVAPNLEENVLRPGDYVEVEISTPGG